jgi:hypothetical protein
MLQFGLWDNREYLRYGCWKCGMLQSSSYLEQQMQNPLQMTRTRTCTHTYTQARTHIHTHTHTHAHAHTHTRAHAHTHTYTHTRTQAQGSLHSCQGERAIAGLKNVLSDPHKSIKSPDLHPHDAKPKQKNPKLLPRK